MAIYFFRSGFMSMAFFLCLCCLAFADKGYTGPDDERAVIAAQKALNSLGPERGALPITGKVVDIMGLKSVAYSGVSVEIDKTLQALGAKKVGTEIQISLSGDILFDFDKWAIKKEAEKTLQKLVKLIGDLNKRHVFIEGHTDSKGSEKYNLKLSHKRAMAVKKWFISKGNLKKVSFQAKGYGEAKPIAPNTKPDGSDNPEGRAANRRVEMRITD
jgi:outer membrane protein OmpA-like peptidoglycan-associated protein